MRDLSAFAGPLRHLPDLADLDEEAWRRLASSVCRVHVPAGGEALTAAERAGSVAVLVAGEVEVRREGEPVATVAAGGRIDAVGSAVRFVAVVDSVVDVVSYDDVARVRGRAAVGASVAGRRGARSGAADRAPRSVGWLVLALGALAMGWLLTACQPNGPACTKTWAGPSAGGTWRTDANWAPAVAPTATDVVCVGPAAVVAVDDDAVAKVVRIDGGLVLRGSASLSVSGSFTTKGTVELGPKATLAVGSYAQPGAAARTVLAPASTLAVAGGGTATLTAGTLAGSGTIEGNVAGGATVAPGDPGIPGSVGRLDVTGSYTAAPGARLVADAVATASFDQLAVTGTADVRSLVVELRPADPAAPAALGSGVPVVAAGARLGPVAGATVPMDATGVLWAVTDGAAGSVRAGADAFTLEVPTAPGQDGAVLVATVAVPTGAPAPSGAVTFRDDGAVVGSAPLVDGHATLPLAALTSTIHHFTASFAGDAARGTGATAPVTYDARRGPGYLAGQLWFTRDLSYASATEDRFVVAIDLYATWTGVYDSPAGPVSEPADGTQIVVPVTMVDKDGGPLVTAQPVALTVSDASSRLDRFRAQGSFTRVVAKASEPVTATALSCCRPTSVANNPGGDFHLRATMDTTGYQDVTSGPRDTGPIILPCTAGSPCTFGPGQVTAMTVRVRLATTAESGATQPLPGPPSSPSVPTVNPDGSVSWPAAGVLDASGAPCHTICRVSAAMAIEHLDASGTLRATTIVQLLLDVSLPASPGLVISTPIVSPLRPLRGQPFTFPVTATDAAHLVNGIATSDLPVGATFACPSAPAARWDCTFSWTAPTGLWVEHGVHHGAEEVCFQASNDAGQSSFGQLCVDIVPEWGPAFTTTVAVSAPASVAVGAPARLVATVDPSSTGWIQAGGTVTFLDGATVLGTAPLVLGTATLDTSWPTAGSHSITASFSGDTTYNLFLPSTSPPAVVDVTG